MTYTQTCSDCKEGDTCVALSDISFTSAYECQIVGTDSPGTIFSVYEEGTTLCSTYDCSGIDSAEGYTVYRKSCSQGWYKSKKLAFILYYCIEAHYNHIILRYIFVIPTLMLVILSLLIIREFAKTCFCSYRSYTYFILSILLSSKRCTLAIITGNYNY